MMDEPKPDSEQAEDVQPEPVEASEAAAGGEVTKDACTFAMLAHLLGLFTGFLGPLIIWLIKKDEHPFVDDQGKEALNFQIMISIGYFISVPLAIVCIGYLTFMALWVLSLVFSIMGAVAANRGEQYRYPLNIRIIK